MRKAQGTKSEPKNQSRSNFKDWLSQKSGLRNDDHKNLKLEEDCFCIVLTSMKFLIKPIGNE